MTDSQKTTLQSVVKDPGVNLKQLDGRSVHSLAKKGFVKVKATKANGSCVFVTAKGNKALQN